jgi:hypothetical protein
MKMIGIVVRCSPILLLLLALAPGVTAQEPADPSPAGDDEAEPAQKEKGRLALYLEAGGGAYAPDDIDPSVETLSTHVTTNTLSWEDQDFARVAIGWKLQRGRGDFRLIFNGYSEDGYTYTSVGKLSAIDPSLGTSPDVLGPLEWWHLVSEDGVVNAVRTPPVWDLADDANGNGFVDPGEQRYVGADIVSSSTMAANLQNRAQTYDLVFGKVWGPRNFQGRWFAGLRYFDYDGNIPQGAWLYTPPVGEGWTEGSLLRLVNYNQDTTGLGPTGLMEARFNFFDQRLQFYINGQATFIVLKIEADSGLFATLVESTGVNPVKIPTDARLHETDTKSTWQTGAEAGFRYRFRNGLKLEMSYGVVGLLDVIHLPTEIRVPENQQEAPQGTSAIYNTQDYVLQGWRAGIAFQF